MRRVLRWLIAPAGADLDGGWMSEHWLSVAQRTGKLDRLQAEAERYRQWRWSGVVRRAGKAKTESWKSAR
jgi:hypothetical protein